MLERHISLFKLSLLAAALSLFFLGQGVVQGQGQDVPEKLAASLDAYAETQGGESAGRCEDADLDEDIGKWCWEIVSITDTEAVADFGPTFAEFEVRTSFVLALGEWQIDAEGVPPGGDNGNGDPEAPDTGTGLAVGDDTGADRTRLLQLAGLAVALSGATGLAVVRIRRQ